MKPRNFDWLEKRDSLNGILACWIAKSIKETEREIAARINSEADLGN